MASSGSFNTSSYGSGDWNRYLNFSWSVQSQSIANNTTTISWTLKGAGGATNNWYQSGNFKVVIDGSTVYSSATRINLMNGTVVASGTFTMTHDSAGNRSFSASAQAGIYYVAVNCTGSGSWSLPTIPRAATITSAPNFNDTDNPVLKYSNPAGNSVTTLQACIADTSANVIVSYRNISKTGSSYTFNLTDAERNALRAKTPNSNTMTVRFYVMTVIGGVTYKNYATATMTIVSANPTFSVAYLDTNSTVTGITGNNQQIVQNQSTLRINVTSAAALKSATLKTATCTVLGTNYSANITNGAATLNIGQINSSSNLTIAVKVTDSRGNSTTKNIDVQVLAWQLPNALITMQRQNNYYSDTDITVDGNYSSVNNKNTLTIQMRYKQTTASSWSAYTTMQDNATQTFTLDNEYEWNVQVLLTDRFGSTTYNLTLSRGLPIVFFDRLKSSTGFNCFPEDTGSVEVNGVNVLRSVMTRNLASNITSPSVNSYTKIAFSGTNSFGSKLTAISDGGIKIGSGVSKVLVSGRMLMSTSTVGESYVRICKNSTDNTVGWVTDSNKSTSAAFSSLTVTPLLLDVQENDVIYMYYYVPSSSITIYGGAWGNQTSITVETVG